MTKKRYVINKIYALFRLPLFIKDFYHGDVSFYRGKPYGTEFLTMLETLQLWRIMWWEE